MKKFLFLLLSCGIFIYACKKATAPDQITPDSINEKTEKKVSKIEGPCPYDCLDERCKAYTSGYCAQDSDPLTVIGNPNNSFDYIGARHNEEIQSIIGAVDDNTPHNYTLVRYWTNSYLANKGYDTVLFNNNVDYLIQNGYYNAPNINYGTNTKDVFTSMYNNGLITSTLKSYLFQIVDLVDNYIGGDNSGALSKYQDLAHAVVTVENQAQADTNLSAAEKQAFMQGCSVLRYSFCFWGNYEKNNPTDVETIKGKATNSIKVARLPFSWSNVGKADYAGAIVGGIVGSIFGGQAIEGAIGGAIIGSGTVAIYQAFHW